MKLVRWLLSNLLLIVFILVLAYVAVYWDRLTDKDTPAGEAIAWLSEGFWFRAEREKPPAEAPTAEPVTPPGNGDVSALQQVGAPEVSVPEAIDADGSSGPTLETGEDSVAEAAVPAPAGPATTQSPAGEKQQGHKPMSTRERWVAARLAYHLGEYDTSVAHYRQLIATTQFNYEALGELGNVYFSRGDIENAATAYFEAAAILVRLGQLDRASRLSGFLEKMDPAKAEDLKKQIASAKSD